MVVLCPRRGMTLPSVQPVNRSSKARACVPCSQACIACYCSRVTIERSIVIGDATLTASGIARLANVGRAAVSNWRRRYADFPTPVGGTPTSPFFDAHEVEQWLRRQGKLHQAGAEHWAWRHIESYQPAAEIGDALGISGAYLLVRSDQPATRSNALLSPKQLISRLRALDRHLTD